MDLGLKDRVILVTGASSGIGRAIAVAFAREGARVAVTYKTDQDKAQDSVKQIRTAGGQGFATRLDLAEPVSIDRAVADVLQEWDHIDVLVANAARRGAAYGVPLHKLGPEELQAILRGNLEGTFATVRAVLPSMHERKWGRIVLMSSGLAEHGIPSGGSVYGAAKAGLHGMARNLAWELGPAGILINVVAAGFTVTDEKLRRYSQSLRDEIESRTPTRRLSVPEDVAPVVVFLGSAANSNISGDIVHEGQAAA
jgi:NAD(P)-dependent dehydrogenase (short-subunit alcohol dehydrogenase family)